MQTSKDIITEYRTEVTTMKREYTFADLDEKNIEVDSEVDKRNLELKKSVTQGTQDIYLNEKQEKRVY